MMMTTLSRDGRVRLPKAARDEAGVRPGQVFDVVNEGRGRIVLHRRTKVSRLSPRQPLFNVGPLPAGTLAAIYAERDPLWDTAESAAIEVQAAPGFEE